MTSGDHLLSPRGVRKKNRVHGRSGPVVAVRPEVRVGVERLRCAGVAEPRLQRLDALSMPDQQGGVEMPQRVEAGPVRRAGPLDGVTPNEPEFFVTSGQRISRALSRRTTTALRASPFQPKLL
jgi:ribosomal protein L15E